MAPNWPRLADILRTHQRFVLTSHVRSDCDALGSELGLAAALRALGKDVSIVNPDAVPPNLAFIDPQSRIRVLGRDVSAADVQRAEVLIVLDTSAWAQLGPMADELRRFGGTRAVIDHHVSEDDLQAELFKDTTAEATGRLVLELCEYLGVTLGPEIAVPLLAAVATDTGWFRFASTQPTTFQAAARLVAAGARPEVLYRELYEQDTLARLRLRGRILDHARVELDGRLIYTTALRDDFEATGALLTDTEDAINLTLAVAGTEVAVIFVEQPDGNFKISFRSRSAVDCSQLAQQFGGGGHKAAAGARVAGPIEAARAKVLDAVRAAMR
jgi:phosphoesterase RecJ-like protein